ncbi:hypothetical protein PTSG_00471 [Salpingoeca rosetta]|uniref:Uncharacterized protein n=1 Tax=Salpingoeca rosetta (strain ATCC 50818 / BSB-021) TaxID=946362 RepID=F2TWK3_SALR5|nr:uncharacterized protein PTSG_00471 [Salpingoeca rosetta]EGD72449.1 hypothetical protein PTSG_00471 [Salpingoeca rosetta]|eukprot:XP_004999018.1 hypothetical protein PTSG_00471 [Salpingoeca rosetta]
MEAALFGDAAHCKAKLDVALGAHKKRYWRMFSQYIKGKRTREQFDRLAAKCLGRLNGHLHNDFILTVFQSAESATNKKKPDVQPPPAPKPTQLSRDSSSWLAQFDRDLEPAADPLKVDPKVLRSAVDTEYRATPAPVTLSKLRAATIVAASENGMRDVEPAVFDVLNAACQTMMKNLLEEAIVYGGKFFSMYQNNTRHSFRNRRNKRSVITPSTLLLASSARPKLLGSLFRTVQESFALRCENPTVLPKTHANLNASTTSSGGGGG